MAARVNAFNTSESPVVIDAEGHRLDGKTSGKVDPDLPEVRAAILSGSLLVSDRIADRVEDEAEPAPDVAPAAVVDAPAGAPAPAATRQKGPRA